MRTRIKHTVIRCTVLMLPILLLGSAVPASAFLTQSPSITYIVSDGEEKPVPTPVGLQNSEVRGPGNSIQELIREIEQRESTYKEPESRSLLIRMKTAEFDPMMEEPDIPAHLKYARSTDYGIVQLTGPVQSSWLASIEAAGATVHGYIPDYAYLLHMEGISRSRIERLPFVRWTGPYHPAYKIQEGLLDRQGDIELNVVVFHEKNLPEITRELRQLEGTIHTEGQELDTIRVTISSSKIRDIAFLPDVEWIDEYTPPFPLMDNVRIFTGAENLHNLDINGTGIVGEVKDNGIDQDHPDFEGQIIGTDGNPSDGDHGTCTFGIVFSSGANSEKARGMIPGAKGVFSDWGVGRGNSVSHLVNNWGGVFQSNSWSQGSLDSSYTSYSQANDQAVYDHDVLMLYAAGNSNQGVYPGSLTQDSVSKNVICVGAANHWDDTDRTNDAWTNFGAGMTPSQGPVADGRIKPDIAGVFDATYTTDSVDGDGENGYSSGNYYSDFGGTSGATPISAGSAGLVYELYRDNHFDNNPSGSMPHAATVKAILIADAYQYDFSQADRFQQGWGLVDVDNIYNIGKNHFIVDQEASLETDQVINYNVSPTGTMPLKITLVWTDVPGTTSSSQHLINNLDLKVTSPGGDVYLGNVDLVNSHWSSTGGSPDTLNNVENVFIENPQGGTWTIEVSAQNIAMDGNPDTPDVDQHFALVASGVIQADHDLGVADLEVPTYLKPNEQVTVTASLFNNGLYNETGFAVNLTVDGAVEDSMLIPGIETGETVPVIFDWTPPVGIFVVGVEVEALPDDSFTVNNREEKVVIAEPDMAVVTLETDSYMVPDTDSYINATVENLGKVDANNIIVQLLVEDTLEDFVSISSLPAGTSQVVTLSWMPETDGWFEIEAYATPVPDEELVANNRMNVTVLATSEAPRKVAILDSYGTDFPDDAPWDYLNGNWMSFGTTPVVIDYTTMNKADISYDELLSMGADVLVISGAFAWEFTNSEIDAIERYVQEGHGLIATFATFYQDVPNNNKLAPLFGMRDDLTYDANFASELDILEPAHGLFFNIPDPHTTGSGVSSQPEDLSWDAEDLAGGRYVASAPDDSGAVVVNKGLVYFTHWIEYMSNLDDVQLLYNAVCWSRYVQESHDLAVMGFEAPVWLNPGQEAFVNASIINLGLTIEYAVTVNLTVNGVLETAVMIPELDPGSLERVDFHWTAPGAEDTYVVAIETPIRPDEAATFNNHANGTVIVTAGPVYDRIGLISDGMQLESVTPVLDELNRDYDVLDDNLNFGYTRNVTRLLRYKMVIFYNENRAIDMLEEQALQDYITIGGVLVVTGWDSLGDPDDPRLARVVRSSALGDNTGVSTFSVTNGSHPIMNGVYGQFPAGSQYPVLETDHDMAEADVQEGAQTVAELPGGKDKIIATELFGGGKVVFWNGNRDCADWIQADLVPMFKNLIVWILPIHDDVGLVELTMPTQAFTGESFTVTVVITNFGLNHQTDVEAGIAIRNSHGFIIHSDTKTGIAVDSADSTSVNWQWSANHSDIYMISISTVLAGDEILTNNLISDSITVYTRFFNDDMESGQGDWETSASSPVRPPLWHLTTQDSHTPQTSWWCGEESTEQYSVLADQYLVSPPIDLRDATTVFLSFHHKYSIDDFPLLPDWGDVEIDSGGAGWETLDSYSGTFTIWGQEIFDISSYAGKFVQVRFTLSSGVLLTDNGWWVDDMEVYGMGWQFGLDMSIPADIADVGQGESATYDVHVANTGNALGTVNLNVSSTEMEGWDISFSQDTLDILPGNSAIITLTVTPLGAVHGNYHGTVHGSIGDGTEIKAQDSKAITTTVLQWYDMDIWVNGNNLYLSPGSVVYYTITVANLGNGPDTIDLTTDASISGISNEWQFGLDTDIVGLNAFSQGAVTLTVQAPTIAYPDDMINIYVNGTSMGDGTQNAAVMTITTVLEYHSMDLNTDTPVKDTEAGVPVVYEFEVKNQGNTQISVDLDVVPPPEGFGKWTYVLSTKDLICAPYTSKNITLTVTPWDSETAFTSQRVNVSAQSPGNTILTVITTSVLLSGDFEITSEETEGTGQPGSSVRYTVSAVNMQNHDDVLDIATQSAQGWLVTLYREDGTAKLWDSDGDGKKDTGSVKSISGTADIVVDVTVPDDALAFSSGEVTLTFSSSLPQGSSRSITLTTEVDLAGGFAFEADKYSLTGIPGAMVSYLVTVRNGFNSKDTLDLTVSSQENWDVTLYDENGLGVLYDTNDNGLPDTGSLHAFGGTTDIMVVLNLQENQPAYTRDVITLTGSSSLEDVDSGSIQLNASIARVYDVGIVQEDGDLSVVQGEVLIYTITLTNRGNSEEILDVRFTEIPFGWRADLSQAEPTVSMGQSKVIAVDIEVPRDTEPGNYLVTISGTSEDGIPTGELSMIIQVEEAGESSELPWTLIWIIVVLVCLVLAAVIFSTRRRGEYEPETGYYPEIGQPAGQTPPITPVVHMLPQKPVQHIPPQKIQPALRPVGALEPMPSTVHMTPYKTVSQKVPITPEPDVFDGPMFMPLEVVTCPNCYWEFDVEVDQWPMRVRCPRCGITGTMT